MSLFLGKIHYWLYNKILWFESIEEDLMNWGQEAGLPITEWKNEIYKNFGMPTQGKPLEDIIDTSNIHGWLQGKIESAELRQAALVTKILDVDVEYKYILMKIFTEKGVQAAKDYHGNATTPEEVYHALNDFILEGMPCDRVNEIIKSNDQEFVWHTTMCLHKPYWDKAKGDVNNFYELREAWVTAFVTTVNPEYKFEKMQENMQKIVRK
ncbi:MAG: hypothetical protein JJT76_01040 [Clostridiaceae bacterium]|nr:hypothetical protein [Clostridiaceae bacterium]